MSNHRVLAFDIGIKNLAYAILNKDTSTVIALENVNLLDPVDPIHCISCKAKASFSVGNVSYCRRHLPKTHAIRPEWSGTKKPSNKMLREWVKEYGLTATGTSNDACKNALGTVLAIPIQQPKQANASHLSLEILHDVIHRFVEERWVTLFAGCTQILLENQPAFKNPHMKSVQVLLFATLREAGLRHGGPMASYHLVHAGKKTKGVKKGDAGYAERKDTSEKRVQEAFEQNQVHGQEWYDRWIAATKKSDMADALCMCMDA